MTTTDTPDALVRIGSICTGSLMLDIAIEHVFDAQTVWCAETDPHATRLINQHRPGLDNLGDLTGIDWHQLAHTHPIDLLAGGYACQPFSLAGRRHGVGDDRHVWPAIADGLAVLRPPVAIFENVAGHLTLGFDQVLADLARIGYQACWTTLPASQIGAPHGRPRLFILAADTRPPGRHLAGRILDRTRRRAVRAGTVHRHNPSLWPNAPPHDHHNPGTSQRAHSPPRGRGKPPVTRLLPTPTTSDRNGPGAYRAGGPGLHTVADQLTHNPPGRGRGGDTTAGDNLFADTVDESGPTRGWLLPTPAAADGYGAQTPTASIRDRAEAGKANLPEVASTNSFGRYQQAINRWAAIIGREPPPITITMTTRKTRQQRRVLNPQFSEWMMGWPPGWATDPHLWNHVPASRARILQLGIIGNGVCVQQAAAALTWLLHIWHTEEMT